MGLLEFLEERRSVIVKRWFHLIADTYPPQTAEMLKKQTNQFTNPVGYALRHGTEGLYGELLRGVEPEKTTGFLDKIIRIRAIQDFTPAQAVGFVFLLKRIIREEVQHKDWKDRISTDDLLELESHIDNMVLLGLNVYAQCREKLYEVRLTEVKNRTFRLLQLANLTAEMEEIDKIGLSPEAEAPND
ncbi:MAG: RsbRD N-terminal domain-containing protein [Syntrophobacteraceae bacterium]